MAELASLDYRLFILLGLGVTLVSTFSFGIKVVSGRIIVLMRTRAVFASSVPIMHRLPLSSLRFARGSLWFPHVGVLLLGLGSLVGSVTLVGIIAGSLYTRIMVC